MKSRYSFSRHIGNHFYIYLICLIGVPVLTCYFINLKTKPKKEETFTIFMDTTFKDEDAFTSLIKTTLPEDKIYNIYPTSRNDSIFRTLMDTQGKSADVLILSKTTLDNTDYMPYISLDIKNKYYSETNYIFYEKHIGVSLPSLNQYLNAEDDSYYYLINQNTVHKIGFSKEGKTDQAYRLLEVLQNA